MGEIQELPILNLLKELTVKDYLKENAEELLGWAERGEKELDEVDPALTDETVRVKGLRANMLETQRKIEALEPNAVSFEDVKELKALVDYYHQTFFQWKERRIQLERLKVLAQVGNEALWMIKRRALRLSKAF